MRTTGTMDAMDAMGTVPATSTTTVRSPTSRLRAGHARADITPPVGIYHRLWGAARHDRATGVHRALLADVLAFAPLQDGGADGGPGASRVLVRAYLDLAGLVQSQHQAMTGALAAGAGVAVQDVVLVYSHTHSSGWFVPDRIPFPGGELIQPYLADLATRLRAAGRRSVADLQDATITYAAGRCDMAASRDYWDSERGSFACGFNPDAPVGAADDTLIVARIAGADGRPRATLVNYACHPTTLAWESSLISPDYPGAARETVERATGAPCVFALGACGDIGPRYGFVGDPGAADRNGEQVGYAALAALAGMTPPATDLVYAGPVVSGATLGVWRHAPHEGRRLVETGRFDAQTFAVSLPFKRRPERAALEAELAARERAQREADARGDLLAARTSGAHAERARRWLARLDDLPEGGAFPLACSIHQLGDAFWVACGGEPYSAIQMELRRRFPGRSVLFSPLMGDLQVAYLLTAERYGLGLYQEEPSILAPGSLERLTDAIAARLVALA